MLLPSAWSPDHLEMAAHAGSSTVDRSGGSLDLEYKWSSDSEYTTLRRATVPDSDPNKVAPPWKRGCQNETK